MADLIKELRILFKKVSSNPFCIFQNIFKLRINIGRGQNGGNNNYCILQRYFATEYKNIAQ